MLTKTTLFTLAASATAVTANGLQGKVELAPFTRAFDVTKFSFMGVKGGNFNIDGFNKETGRTIFDQLTPESVVPAEGYDSDTNNSYEEPDNGLMPIDDDDDDEETASDTDYPDSTNDMETETAAVVDLCELYMEWSIDELMTLKTSRSAWLTGDCDFDGFTNGYEVDNYDNYFDPYVPNVVRNVTVFMTVNQFTQTSGPVRKREANTAVPNHAWKRRYRQGRSISNDDMCFESFDLFLTNAASVLTLDDVDFYDCSFSPVTAGLVELDVHMNTELSDSDIADVEHDVNGSRTTTIVNGISYNVNVQDATSTTEEAVLIDEDAMVYDFVLSQDNRNKVLDAENWFNGCSGNMINNIHIDDDVVVGNATIQVGEGDYSVYSAFNSGGCPDAITANVELKSEISTRRRRV